MKDKQQDQNRFDEMMFGKRQTEEEDPPENTEESFDLFQTIQLVNDTYQKLSPLKKLVKNPFKN